MSISQQNRDPLFDVVKALMMVWVIWGHLGQNGIVPEKAGLSLFEENLRLGVNMPIFFVISGYFAAKSFAEVSLVKSLVRSVTMMWPQVVYGVLWGLVLSIAVNDSFSEVFSTIFHYWFLKCLAIIYLVSAAICWRFKSNRSRWLAFAAVYSLLLFWPTRFNVWWMKQLIHMLPYFVFGLMILSARDFHKRAAIALPCGIAYFVIAYFEGDCNANGMSFWAVYAHWRNVLFKLHDFITFFGRTFVGITGSVFVLWFVDRILKLIPKLSWISVLGTSTLGVYVIHEYPMFRFGSAFSVFPLPGWSRWLVAVGCLLVCHAVVMLIKRWRVSRVCFFGNERWLNSILVK